MADGNNSVSKDRAILTAEVISPFLAKLDRFLDFMPNPDELLKDTGESLEIYQKMLLDARIFSLLEIRKSEVLNFPFYVLPGGETPRDKEIANFVSKTIKSLNLYQELKELLSALEFGFSLSEVVWELRNGKWIPLSLKSRKNERFNFKTDGTPILITPSGRQELKEPYKFIVHRHNPQAENPYGNSVLKQCYWPWMFKKAGWRFWLTAAEKFGVPTVLVIFETDDEQKAKERAKNLAESLSGIQSDAAVALANVKEVTTLEIKGDLSAFKVLIEACDTQISYGITGQSLATAESKYGTRAQGQVHENILRSITVGDARQINYTLNKTLIAWITELNFGSDVPKPILEYDLDEYASWEIVKDAIDRGVEVSKSALYTKYNIPKPADDKDVFVLSSDFIKGGSRQPPAANLNMSDGFFLPIRRPLRISNKKS
ncbi:MAG: DUF935 family protein [Nitrospinae bacterium]|nr:DUF935 family protein [Nitrospinota bacterium]